MTAIRTRPVPPAAPASGPLARLRERLFPNPVSTVVSLFLIPLSIYLLYRAFLFVVVNGRWEAVSRNLTLFMQGTFPRDEQWRIVVQLLLLALALGIGLGTASASRQDRAREAGLRIERAGLWGTARRFWSVIAFVLALLLLAGTVTPWLVVAGVVAAIALGYLARFIPGSLRQLGWAATALVVLAGFQVVSGTDGRSWVPAAIVVMAAVWFTARFEAISARTTATRVALTVAAGLLVYFLYSVIDFAGISWDNWSGLHLTLWVSALAIVLSFPLGLLLALARRSSLPALRFLATGYIELIRGVPLITLLFMGRYILGFMLPAGSALSDVSRAIAAMTLFTAAYVAEIVRGGLQALPHGQTEAGQALGLSPSKAMRLIILPQALRAVIPAMVGQFISIFKDSSLLEIIAINEFLGVRSLVHAQTDFRSVAHAETLVFVALGYWAFSYAMSRESQNLERRLRVSR